MRSGPTPRAWTAAIVALHLVMSVVHGAAHDRAHVAMPGAANLFVFVVILGGPLAGVALLWRAPQFGGPLVAVTMAGSLLFGLVNHFVLPGPDHVAQVAASWRPMFTATAVLLALTEAAGTIAALRVARERIRES
jgi:hypothetical protein